MADLYKVTGLHTVRETLAQWKRELPAAAYAKIEKALETMVHRLSAAPEECGEPENNIFPNGVIHTAFQHPLILKYAVYRDQKAVVIKRLHLLNLPPEQ